MRGAMLRSVSPALVFAATLAASGAIPVTVEEPVTRGELPTAWGEATDDLDRMRARGVVRALVVPGRVSYYVQGGRQRGANYEWLVAFEKHLNRARKKGQLPVRVAIVPSSPATILDDLVAGRGDIAAMAMVETPERAQRVEFVAHVADDTRKIAVTRVGAPPLPSLGAVAGREVWVLRGSSAQQQLGALNAGWRKAGKPTARLRVLPDHLTDDDLLEMVDAGLASLAFVSSFRYDTWKPVLERLQRNDGAVLAEGERLAWAVRKDNPLLKAELDAYWPRNRVGTKLGNILVERYLEQGASLKDPSAESERRKYGQMVGLFRKHAARYHMDFLLMMAQGYQESQLDQSRRSPVGAIGVMQLMPATGRQMAVGDISQLEPNIHAGVKYLRWIIDEHFDDPRIGEVDRVLLAFAGYNAGPSRIQQMRREAAKRGLDPDRWFGNVELVTAQRVGREPVDYVANIYKYYLAYKLVEADAKPKGTQG